MLSITIEKITIPYDKELLYQWKQRDPKIVPQYLMGCKGPGVRNGYGFGEWMAERFFRDNGYCVFANGFDLISNKSKYRSFNRMIETMITPIQLQAFKETLQTIRNKGIKVENPDLFVFNLETFFFAEAKKGKDRLRNPQMIFFYLAKEFLGIDSKLIYLCDKATEVIKEESTFNFELPLDLREQL
jgi:hypothetical protein